jgi:hypothetical protein
MPNHVHGIVALTNTVQDHRTVGAQFIAPQDAVAPLHWAPLYAGSTDRVGQWTVDAGTHVPLPKPRDEQQGNRISQGAVSMVGLDGGGTRGFATGILVVGARSSRFRYYPKPPMTQRGLLTSPSPRASPGTTSVPTRSNTQGNVGPNGTGLALGYQQSPLVGGARTSAHEYHDTCEARCHSKLYHRTITPHPTPEDHNVVALLIAQGKEV